MYNNILRGLLHFYIRKFKPTLVEKVQDIFRKVMTTSVIFLSNKQANRKTTLTLDSQKCKVQVGERQDPGHKNLARWFATPGFSRHDVSASQCELHLKDVLVNSGDEGTQQLTI
jgi:hypothetical protein